MLAMLSDLYADADGDMDVDFEDLLILLDENKDGAVDYFNVPRGTP